MPDTSCFTRPYTAVVLAMSADGKIADNSHTPARFSSPADQVHLEQQIALSDATLFGANTLRAYGTTLSVSNPQLLETRSQQQLPSQPIQIVCSPSGDLNPQLRFFRQAIPRWLLTTSVGAKSWTKPDFEQILVVNTSMGQIDWHDAFFQLTQLGIKRLSILGGGELVASLLAADFIDEFWLTVCPIILGGTTAPTPVAGAGFFAKVAPRLELLSVKTIEQEVFLHYRRLPS
jgi:5-amino-6-(5-phosphoribosylamino)uracil reductase